MSSIVTTALQPNITINVDLTNPGQFFACCGLFEIADRLWPGTLGWFGSRAFHLAVDEDFETLLDAVRGVELCQLDPENKTASPIAVKGPFHPLRLDWWLDEQSGGKKLKVWAGTMESVKIARAMQAALRDEQFATPALLDVGVIAYDVDPPHKKVEPFYFDARRGPNAHSRDVGFSPNTLSLTTTAFPAVELLCLVGLQRCLPAVTARRHVYEYSAWGQPAPLAVLGGIVCGAVTWPQSQRFRFENWYRTGQKKHQAFRSAIFTSPGEIL